MNRVSVTGGTGFVGRHLVERLHARGDDVVCLVRSRLKASHLERLGCRVVHGDLEDPRALAALTDGAEAVFHVAGCLAATSKGELFRVNHEGTRRLARAAREAGVGRLVFVSSLAVTGPTVPGEPLDALSRPNPITPYGESKWAGERAVSESGVPFTIVRPPVVYGPGDRQTLPLFRLARWGLVPLLGDGRQELSVAYVADLAEALVSAADSETAEGNVYHAGHPDVITQRGFAEAVATAMERRARLVPLPHSVVRGVLRVTGVIARWAGKPTVLSPDKAPELLAPAWTCSSAALERDTGWEATTPLAVGLSRAVSWYRGAGWV